MNKTLLDFYSGIGVDNKHRSFEEIIELGDNFLERSHDLIQWIFPLTEPSLHNPHAPLLDQETIEAMKENEICILNLRAASVRFLSFLARVDENGKPVWVSNRNHNYLRITRAIKCLKLFGLDSWAKVFFELAMDIHNSYPQEVGQETLQYWMEAMDDAQEASETDQSQ